jgi:hypothetical protein
MAYTQADLDAIDAEIAKVRTIKATSLADRSVTFRNLDELTKERARVAAAIAQAAGTSRVRYAATSKGV